MLSPDMEQQNKNETSPQHKLSSTYHHIEFNNDPDPDVFK